MCGIAGIVGTADNPATVHELSSMCSALVSRGPDDEGLYFSGSVGLGMRRLSIIDVDNGHQPVRNEEGTVWVVLNGEIYNYRELRRELESLDHRFYTATDTEVIVHLYEQYGIEGVQRLRGMFAFALWDNRKKQLLLVRDRLGVKPLYYGTVDGRFLFASELKALLQLPTVARELDWNSVGHLFSFLSTPPDHSIIRNIHKLEPGHLLILQPGQSPKVSQYWDVRFMPDYSRSESSFVEGLRHLLEESVKLRMISDVPVGAFLSGGVDSSSVVAMMARLGQEPVRTFSIGFPETGYDESGYARQVSRAFGTIHRELVLEPDILGVVEDIAWHLDEPFGDSSAIPTYMVSRLAAEDVKVVLSGDGGDELFAGYDKYVVESRERNRNRFIPYFVRRLMRQIGNAMPEGARGRNFLRHNGLNGAERYMDGQTMFQREHQSMLFRPEIAECILQGRNWEQIPPCLVNPDMHWLSAIQYLDIKNYLPLDILTKVDRMSMAHSLEAREPLLDHKLVEFAATIPPEMKLRNGRTKDVMKRAMEGILPDGIINRRKQGFAVPLGRWFRGQLTEFVQDLLLSETCRSRGIFNPGAIERIVAMHNRGRDLDLHIWTMISFELWCRMFLDSATRKRSAIQEQRRAPVLVGGNAGAA